MSETNPTVEEREQLSEQGGQRSPGAQAPGGPPAHPAPDGDGAGTERAQPEAGADLPEGGADLPEAGADEQAASTGPTPQDEAVEIAGDLDSAFDAHGELVRTAAERDQYLALAQRTQADFENYRKRVAREAAAAQRRGIGALAKELLPALDNLDRALEAAATDDPLLEGVRLVRAELSAALARVGIESFCPVGEAFDPELHEAVATAEQGEGGYPSGTVVEVFQHGYRLGDSIIRPARVVVAA